MLDEKECEAALSNFKAELTKIGMVGKDPGAPLLAVIEKIETQDDCWEFIYAIIKSAATLETQYCLLSFIFKHYNPQQQQNKLPWVHNFQGYAANILMLYAREYPNTADIKDLVNGLILSWYNLDDKQIELLSKWLIESKPTFAPEAEKIGIGTYADVYVQKTQAVKEAVKSFKDVKIMKTGIYNHPQTYFNILNEGILLKLLSNSEHFIKIHGISLNPEPVLTMEYAEGRDLFSFIFNNATYIKENHLNIMTQLLLGLKYMHENKIIHRDIKPSNILLCLENGHHIFKFCDFGSATHLDQLEWLSHEIKTTYVYAATEVLNQNLELIKLYPKAGDVWSLGVVLAMLFGSNENPLHHLSTDPYNLQQIKKCVVEKGEHPQLNEVPESCRSLLVAMWLADPAKRLTTEQAYSQVLAIKKTASSKA